MKFNAGIITDKMAETKAFYTDVLGFNIHFENDFYLLLGRPSGSQISFLLPNHPSQQPIFQAPFQGQGVYLTVDVAKVDEVYGALKAKGVEIVVDIRDEPWGDRHFAIVDPNGIGIDIVTYSAPEGQE
ncbi:MAG: VOC family protein [Spirulinaceae cyanobacterium]